MQRETPPHLDLRTAHCQITSHPRVWWIMDDGSQRPGPHAPVANDSGLFDPTNTNNSPVNVAFRLLNLIRIEETRDTVEIQWDVKLAAEDAVVAALEWLAANRSRLRSVTLHYFFSGWLKETYTNAADAMDRYCEIIFHATDNAPRCLVDMTRLDLFELARSPKLVQQTFGAWKDNDGDLRKLLEQSALSRSFLATNVLLARTDNDRLAYTHIGQRSPTAQVYGREWCGQALGRGHGEIEVDDQYEAEVSDSYFRVMESGVPRLDHIRALITRSDGEPVWVAYQRLLLPLRTDAREPALAVASGFTHDMTVPSLAGI